MKDIKLRDIMDVREKIRDKIESEVQKISVAERILPSGPTLKNGPMYGHMLSASGRIDNKEMCLSDIYNRIVSEASIGLSDEIDQRFMFLVHNRTLGRDNPKTSVLNLYSKMVKNGFISHESEIKLKDLVNSIPFVRVLERGEGKAQSSDYVVLMQALAERNIPEGVFLVNSFVAGEILQLNPMTFEVSQATPVNLVVHGCPVIIPRKNEIVGDSMFLFADKQYLGEAERGELWLQIDVTSCGISWNANVNYSFDIQANAVVASVLKYENDSN